MMSHAYLNTPFRSTSRRSFLAITGSLAAASLWSVRADDIVRDNLKLPDAPFQLGVASGDPGPDGFVIWTRLAPRPLDDGGGMPREAVQVNWSVATDEKMAHVVQRGSTVATPDWGHSVHVEVTGLKPNRVYYYQFQAVGETSPVGRSRTFPAATAPLTAGDRLRFAFTSCQHYEHGLFTAYEHLAKEELDFVAHLGDYLYEYATQEKKVRRHNSKEIETLDEYRNRHALYKTDSALQAAHAAFPWIVTWDDHEFDNNCAGDISEEPSVLKGPYLQRRAQAYQAYYEHMPLRRSSLPQGPSMQLYRQLRYGNLADFLVLDTRQYRTDQPCGDGNKPPSEEVLDARGTLLGEKQEKWLLERLGSSQSRWNVLAQQVMMARVDRAAGEKVTHSMDQWPGYEQNRRRVLKAFVERKVSNPVVLGGDIHSNWANDLIADFDDLDSRIVGSEFVGTSISSGGDGMQQPKQYAALMAENPFVKFHNTERGYVRCEVTPEQWQTDYQVVEYVTRPGAPLQTRASFVVENGRPGVTGA
jgi:alkaline phosphatase D